MGRSVVSTQVMVHGVIDVGERYAADGGDEEYALAPTP